MVTRAEELLTWVAAESTRIRDALEELNDDELEDEDERYSPREDLRDELDTLDSQTEILERIVWLEHVGLRRRALELKFELQRAREANLQSPLWRTDDLTRAFFAPSS